MQFDFPLLLDGAMGTMLHKAGLKPGELPELLNLTSPERIRDIHRAYIEAGSRVIYANTFGANRLKLEKRGIDTAEVVRAGIRAAREAAGNSGCLVALDVGPLGTLLEPLGTLPFETACGIFAEIMAAGAGAGADLVVIETMSDLYEAKAALLAAKEQTKLPVFVTMSFEASGRTFTGCSIPAMAHTLESLGADAIGINCSLGPEEMLPLIRQMRAHTTLPLIAKPNAGLPDPVTGAYLVDEVRFSAAVGALAESGAEILGGCCGTTPDYVRALKETMRYRLVPMPVRSSCVCSATVCVSADRVRPIGERINPTGKKRFQQALLEDDMDYIVDVAIGQAEAGAEILDVNVGYPGVNEAEMLPKVVKAIQETVDLPLMLDSSDPAALEAALRVYNGKPAVNSVNGTEESLSAVLPLVKKYGAAVVGLTLDGGGMPATAEQRLAIAKKILDRALALGIPREDVWIDCLTLTVSAQQDQAAETLRAVELVSRELGLNTVLGVSNISFGLPNRPQITQSFLLCAMQAGLRLPIVNPNQSEIMDAIAAFRVLSGEDGECRDYVARFADAPAAPPAVSESGMTLEQAITRGVKGEAGRLAREALTRSGGMELVEQSLIPALERVGVDYENGKVFLPQILSSAEAAKAAFEEIKTALLSQGGAAENRGTILMATVRGDIHDIGKNIVSTVLENYGYQIVDLGRDVPPERVVREVSERHIRLVGLSALMTTTLPSMAETVRRLRQLEDPPAVMVGGAVVTEQFAASIGADYYAADVRDSVKIAQRVFVRR